MKLRLPIDPLRRSCAAAVLGALCLLTAAPAPGRPAPPAEAPVQRLDPDRSGNQATLESEHFRIVYNTERLKPEQAEEARALAEQGWARCEKLFGPYAGGKLRLDLTPNFYGATGFARPGDPKATDPRRQPMIGVRYADLEYLGLSGDYVLAHEIAHVFSGDLAATSLGEGIADWAAGGFSGIPMGLWWGAALRERDLWIDPDAFFITGDFEQGDEVDAPIRTAQYVEAALLVRYLVERYGWEKTRTFAGEYGKARGSLNSNAERRRLRLPPRFRLRQGQKDPRVPPDAAEIRAVFPKHFGIEWESLRSEWRAAMDADRPPSAATAERFVLAQRAYGAVRNWEMWVLRQRPAPDAGSRAAVREAFTEANRLVAAGDLEQGARALDRARAMVEALRRPRAVARHLPGRREGAAGRALWRVSRRA